ncbi:GIY-YIG nuclease family protein [Saccharibacter floricola]|uniref:DUF4357 domain-containing protein n=1 Tax=Saccharibacter floricola DSM 15669 TaxID=1123227 RepID=A0ABQ0NZL7_9PROT|nr:GIY-YIG nuclease family protein [Saccharibacter floricola]GBQ07364.1 hypothetical protein AA15669_1342 [Saccharibacter floricola DSM 15669]
MGVNKRSLELFYIDGRPDGLLTAEIFDWTGHVLVVPRLRLKEALVRSETAHAGVYLLLGENEQGRLRAYIGEAEELRTRLGQHARADDKQWWEKAVLVTTTNNQLHKAYGRYLEARLIEQAQKVQRALLENNTSPSVPVLREAERANMEGFLDNLFMVLPAVRVDMFIENARPAGSTLHQQPVLPQYLENELTDDQLSRFELNYRKYHIRATAVLQDGNFVVEAGSEAYPQWKGDKNSSYSHRHEELSRNGVLKQDGQKAIFVTDYVCSSTSEAAAIVKGRSAAGPTSWRLVGTHTSYKEWEAQRLEEDAVSVASSE